MERSFLNPFPFYKKMREESPVFYDPEFMTVIGRKGAWQIFRYEDVRQVAKDYRTFTVEYMPKQEENPLSYGLNFIDPPHHSKVRSLVTDFFTPQAIKDMKPWISDFTDMLLDKVEEKGEMETLEELAIPIPIQVIAEILGVPFSDKEKFKEWSITITQNPNEVPGGPEKFLAIQQEMGLYFMKLIEERMQNPKKDLISKILYSEINGEKLTTIEVLGFCFFLLIAGNETTTNLFANTLYALTQFPDVQAHLSKHPEDIPKALEESLRFRSPMQSTYRMAAVDVEFRGQQIKKGDFINFWMGSANHDETVFPNPDVFDINRSNLNHISFGYGIHHCLGASLARMEAITVFEKLLKRFHNIQLKTDTKIEVQPSEMMYAFKALPVTFEKR